MKFLQFTYSVCFPIYSVFSVTSVTSVANAFVE